MQAHECTATCLPRTQGVKIQTLRAISAEYRVDLLQFFCRQGNVHQAGGRSMHQLPAGPYDVGCHEQRNGRIEPEPATPPDQTDAPDDPDGSPHVGHQVMCVSFQSDGILDATDAHQDAGGREVDDRGGYRNQQADADGVERLRMQEAIDGGEADAAGRQQNQEAFKGAGEVLGLAMTMRMIVIGRLSGQCQHPKSHHRPGQVDERFDSVR